jgi:cytidylate kinase
VSLARRLGISPAEAAVREKRESKARDRFGREHLGADVADPAHYDAVFNNERHGVEAIAAAIIAYVRSAMPAG